MVKHFDKNATIVELMGKYINDATLHTLSQVELADVFSSMIKNENEIYTDNAPEYNKSAREAKIKYDSIPIDVSGLSNAQIKERSSQRDSYWHDLERTERVLEGLDTEVKEISETAAKDITTLKKLDEEYAELNIPVQAPIADINILKNTAFSSAINTRSEKVISEYKDVLAKNDYINDQEVKDLLNTTNALFVGGVSHLEAMYKNKSTFENSIAKLKAKKTSFDTAAGTVLNTANLNTYKTEIEAAKKLHESFQELNIAPRITVTDVDAFKKAVYSTALTQNIPESVINAYKAGLAESEFSNDPEIIAGLAELNGLFSAADPLGVIITNKDEIEKKVKKLKDKKASFDTAAGAVINTADFNTFKTEYEKEKKEYEDKRKELLNYTSAAANLNQSWLNVVKTYGKKFVNGQTLTDSEKKNKDYKKVYGAYVSSKIDEALRTPDIIANELIRIDAITSRKDAIKELASLQEDIDSVKEIYLGELNEELKDAYKNVIMGSSLDDANNNTGEFDWFMFDKNGKITEDHEIGTYAQGGIGMFHEMFLADTALETEFYNIQDEVVKKHKKASSWLYGGFFNKKKNTRIAVDDVLKLGLGYAVYLNPFEYGNVKLDAHIDNAWAEVLNLHQIGAANTIEDIIKTYNWASKLGEKANDAAKEWTERKNGGYARVDNQINSLSGWSFRVVDSIWDYLGEKWAKVTKNEEKYDVDITAIKPKSHPHLQVALGLFGLGAVATAAIDETVQTVGSEEHLSGKIAKMGDLVEKYYTFKGITGGLGHHAAAATPNA